MTEKQYNKFYKKIYKIYKCNEKNPEIILDDINGTSIIADKKINPYLFLSCGSWK